MEPGLNAKGYKVCKFALKVCREAFSRFEMDLTVDPAFGWSTADSN